ncbi:MAG: CapA family protein [Ignavibacteriaceae bacterium]
MILIFLCFLTLYKSDLSAQIKIKAVGDIMLGSITPKKILPSKNGLEFYKSLGNILMGADIIFGNLEGTFIAEGMEPQKCSERSRKAATCYEFGMPEILAPILKKLGFNVLNQDNNHSEDYGEEGYLFTQNVLKEMGIKFLPKKSLAEFKLLNTNVALVAFGYSENSHHISDLINAQKVISALNDKYEIIIVSFHGGAEGKNATVVEDSVEIYLEENRGNVLAFAHTVIDAGADMVIGHGPHVLRAMEIYKNKLIAYSLGNFLTYGNINVSGINGVNIILDVTLNNINGDFLTAKLIPIKQIGNGIPMYDESLEGIKLIKNFSRRDFPAGKLLFFENGTVINSGKLLTTLNSIAEGNKTYTLQNSMKTLDLSKYQYVKLK